MWKSHGSLQCTEELVHALPAVWGLQPELASSGRSAAKAEPEQPESLSGGGEKSPLVSYVDKDFCVATRIGG